MTTQTHLRPAVARSKSRLIVALPLVLMGSALSAVAAPPADKNACYALAFQLADRAAKAKLQAADAANVESLLSKLEAECVAGAFDKAASIATDIQKAIPGGR